MLSCSTHITALSVSSLKRHFEKRALHSSFVHQIGDYFARSQFYNNQKVWLVHLRLWTYSKRLLQARFFFLPTLPASCNYQAKGNTALVSLYCWTMAAFILAFMQKKVCMVIVCAQKADDPVSPATWENKTGLHESST